MTDIGCAHHQLLRRSFVSGAYVMITAAAVAHHTANTRVIESSARQ